MQVIPGGLSGTVNVSSTASKSKYQQRKGVLAMTVQVMCMDCQVVERVLVDTSTECIGSFLDLLVILNKVMLVIFYDRCSPHDLLQIPKSYRVQAIEKCFVGKTETWFSSHQRQFHSFPTFVRMFKEQYCLDELTRSQLATWRSRKCNPDVHSSLEEFALKLCK